LHKAGPVKICPACLRATLFCQAAGQGRKPGPCSLRPAAQQPVEKGALETLTKRFSTALDASLSDWQAAHGGVILVKGAVVAGVTDITPVIQADIARQMQGAP